MQDLASTTLLENNNPRGESNEGDVSNDEKECKESSTLAVSTFEQNVVKGLVAATFKLDALKENLFDLLAASKKEHHKIIGKFCESLSPNERIYFLEQMLPLCLDSHNAQMLKALLEVNESTINQVKISKLLNEHQQELLKKLLDTDELKPGFKKNLLAEFEKYGHVTVRGIKLTIAQIASRKNKFNPAVISPEEDFSRYLKAVKIGMGNPERPLREVFIVGDPNFPAGTHWICGIIDVDAKNKVRMLLIDSRGTELLPIA
jgi:hypothetical protein